ncbi:hypothetical protein ES703_50931 [subsurface metagenome]
MKRRTILVLLALVVLVLGSSYASAYEQWGTLWAGQNSIAGYFHVFTTGTGLRITINPQSGWKITESHVAVHTSPANIPQNKNGNPRPGHFTWSQKSAPTTIPHKYTIPYSEIEGGLIPGVTYTLYIAIHAVVFQTDSFGCIIQDETAWGGPCYEDWSPGDPLPYPFVKLSTNRWGYYFEFEVTVPL